MSSAINYQSRETSSYQKADTSSQSPFCLSKLPPELMIKIVSFASESFGELRLTCKQIERSLREVTKKATLKVEAYDGAEFSMTPLKPLKFSALRAIDLGQAPLRHVELPTYSNLQKIAMGSQVHVTDAFLNSLSFMPHLRALKVGACLSITRAGWTSFFENHPDLEELNLRRFDLNETKELIIDDLSKLLSFKLSSPLGSNDQFLRQILKAAHQLQKLKVEGYPHMTSDILNAISSSKLTRFDLDLRDCQGIINWEWNVAPFADFIKRCTQLSQLCIYISRYSMLFSNFQDLNLSDFCHVNIRILKLEYFTLKEIRFIFCCAPHLEELQIKNCFARGAIFKPLYGLTNLKVLNILSTEGFSEDSSQALTLTASKLSTLNISHNSGLPEDFWRKSNLKNLREFNFIGRQGELSDIALADICDMASAMPNLQHLCLKNGEPNLYKNISNGDENLEGLTAPFQNLKTLKLHRFESFTNSKLLCLLGRAPELEQIELVALKKLTNNILSQLISNLPKLKSIYLGCSNITEEVPRDISTKLIRYIFYPQL